jgi:hypothetical protein
VRNAQPILARMMAGRACRPGERRDGLTPPDRRGCPPLPLQGEWAQGALDKRRAVFQRRADTGLLLPLRDRRLQLPLYRHRPPTPCAPTDVPQMC